MGTRHLIAVYCDGTYKVAQYGQWDGYPGGQGVDVLRFCRKMNRDAFIAKVRSATFIDPEFSRDTGSDILDLVMQRPDGIALSDSIKFAADSLFCEWAWVIDLDRGTFEAFKGFNKSPLAPDERFAFLDSADAKYHPVKLIRSWPLADLPSDDDFLATFVEE